jgi:hypothetical protein
MHSYIRYIFILVTWLCFITALSAQEFGGNRTCTKWYQLKTDSLRIIFPKELETQAKDISKSGHWILQQQNPLGNKHKRISIILQNQTTISNGYVGIAPRRSEFFMMPELSNIELTSLPWHLQLSLHEMRHVAQFNNFNRGVAKGMGLLLGEQGQALSMNAIIPNWFWEGDAVNQETQFTGQGRGRLPFFFNGYRSLWMANTNYRFQKLRCGSLRHYIPDHYQLGYLLVNYGEYKYGNDFWKKVTHRALKPQSPVYSFQHAIKKESGLNYRGFIRNAFNYYKDSFDLKSDKNNSNNLISRDERNNVVTYEYPYQMEDGSIMALRTGYRDIQQWVIIDTHGKIQKLRIKDISQNSYYTYKNGLVVYTAYETHPRWSWENYSVIKLWDVKADKVKRITSKTRLFQPDISADNKLVVAVHSGTDMKSALALIDIGSKKIKHLPNKDLFIYTYPRFTKDGNAVIAAVRNTKGYMGILKTDIQSGKTDTLMKFINLPIAYLYINDDNIFFTAPDRDRDALFMLNQYNGEFFKVKTLPNGIYQPNYKSETGQLLWVTQNINGLHIGRDSFFALDKQKLVGFKNLDLLYAGEKSKLDYLKVHDTLPERSATIKRYRSIPHLFYPHSWRPVIYEPDYGLRALTDNVLNNFQGEINYNYNVNESSHTAGFNLIYGGWYPQFYAGVSNSWNRRFIDNSNNSLRWNESSIKVGMILPFTFIPGKTIHRITLNTGIQFDDIQYTGLAAKKFENENFHFQSTGFNWVHQSQQARQHIFPKWAQSFRAEYRSTISGEPGNQIFLNAGVFFPGLFKNHHLVFFGSVQNRDTLRGILFSNNLPFSRGYNAVNFPRALRWSVNYHFPLFYPDFGIGHLLYFLRVRANVFYDYTQGRSLRTGRNFPLRSAGGELFFDTKFWNQFPISFGLRYARLLDNDLIDRNLDPNQIEIVIPMNIF